MSVAPQQGRPSPAIPSPFSEGRHQGAEEGEGEGRLGEGEVRPGEGEGRPEQRGRGGWTGGREVAGQEGEAGFGWPVGERELRGKRDPRLKVKMCLV